MSLLSIEQIPQTLAGMIARVTENRYGILDCSSVAFVKASVPYLEAFFLFLAFRSWCYSCPRADVNLTGGTSPAQNMLRLVAIRAVYLTVKGYTDRFPNPSLVSHTTYYAKV
jgi:hypothetical protein